MTPDELAKLIPPEVVEAAAKRHYEECCELFGITRNARKWEQLTPDEQDQSRVCARAVITTQEKQND